MILEHETISRWWYDAVSWRSLPAKDAETVQLWPSRRWPGLQNLLSFHWMGWKLHTTLAILVSGQEEVLPIGKCKRSSYNHTWNSMVYQCTSHSYSQTCLTTITWQAKQVYIKKKNFNALIWQGSFRCDDSGHFLQHLEWRLFPSAALTMSTLSQVSLVLAAYPGY